MIGPVFISYSRKDYYFAESLAFHLIERGIPAWLDAKDLKPGVDWASTLETALDTCRCVILIASPDSLSSQNVRYEWQRARQQGKRIIAARFRGRDLPAELLSAEIVDFRGAFTPALEWLAERLTSDSPSADTRRRPSITALNLSLPPWVAVISVILGVLSLFPLLLADYGDIFTGTQGSTGYRMVINLLLVVTIGLFLWHFMFAFVLRRMSMTRLALCFIFFVYATGYPLLQHFAGARVPELFPEATMGFIRNHWPIAGILFAMALSGLGIMVFKVPEDLLRWTPTGRAWSRFRVGHAANAVADAADIPSRFREVKRFYLVHDVRDTPGAERLRQELLRAGATEATSAAADATAVLLLTNRTRTAWLDSQAQRLQGALLTAVGTGIRLPDSLGWLWKRQWIDFRLWNAQSADREAGLPQVPEALTRLRFPSLVNCTHHLLCATGALLFTAGNAAMPEVDPTAETLPLNEAIGMLSFIGATLWALPARRLLRRTFTETQFFRYAVIGFIATIALVSWDLYDFAMAQKAFIRVILPVVFLIAAPLWLLYQRHALRFWFPQAKANQDKKAESLAPGRNWRTLLWFTVYSLVWIAALNPDR